MTYKKLFSSFNLADVQSGEENRRRNLLNIFLIGISLITVIILIVSIIFRNQEIEGATFIFYAAPILLVICMGIYFIGQRNVKIASTLFVFLMLVAITFSDTPQQVLEGRSLFFMIAPIMIASFIISPLSSFITAATASLLLFLLASSADLPMNYVGAVGFFLFAFVSWLASNAYEKTLGELKEINIELDQRVEARTNELAEANERLKDLDKLKTLFVSNVSHELRTPISNISMYLEMLEQGDPLKRTQYMQILQDETDRLTTLVKDTLDLSRLELGTIRMNIAEININDICHHVVSTNTLRAEERDLHIELETEPEITNIWGDREKLTQVIQNLVSNAINYTPFGKIWVNTETVEENGQKFACIKVKDTGQGIDKDDLNQLFTPFFRGTRMNQSAIPGTGLGLAISKEIVEYHQGKININSEPGVGSTFTVYLPITPAPEIFEETEKQEAG